MESFDVVVVGAGQAGLSVSYLLSEAGLSHVVFERGRVGESWRSQRWDSFTLNTPNWSNLLPGQSAWDGDRAEFTQRCVDVHECPEFSAAVAKFHRQ